MRRCACLLMFCALLGAAPPRPLPDHPGNIFIAGERVAVAPISPKSSRWQLLDYDSKVILEGPSTDKPIELGELPVGYYQLRGEKSVERVHIGVIAPLATPTPATSPIGLDVAMAWFYKTEAQQRAAANLCALAGVNWVRDRLNWEQLEPQRGQFASHNIYDDSAAIQSEAGLRVLQVNHLTPKWAGAEANRFPPDLRDLHDFYRAMAQRFKGKVLAFEPWNEADIKTFGGHSGCEIAALQKSAYLGLKSGNADVIVCQAVFALANKQILEDCYANRPWPYYDTYNLHHYVDFDRYASVYAAHRAVCAQRPMWVSECSVPVEWQGDAKIAEPSDADLRVQAERVAKVYATSLFEGSVNTFYFLLPHYVENKTQFGLLHEDLTPRPAYLALAAVGRLLAGAQRIGGWQSDDPAARGYVFAAKPDGQDRRVLVIWRSAGARELPFNQRFERVFDHLGREKKDIRPGRLAVSPAPIFVILPNDGSAPVAPPPVPQTEPPSKIVLQPLFDPKSLVLGQSAYVLDPKQPGELKMAAYNFSGAPVHVDLMVDPPHGWKCRLPQALDLAPRDRKEFSLSIAPHDPAPGLHPLTIVGAAGDDHPLLSFRLLDERPQPATKPATTKK